MDDQNPCAPIPVSFLDSFPKTGNTFSSPPKVDDSNMPIARQKDVRTCTQHPISNFVSYHAISPYFQNYVVSLSLVTIPCKVFEALAQP